MREILQNLTETLNAGGEALLCQVVETRGSTPQKAGALMIVDPLGGQVGTLGGGCVENEVKLAAMRLAGTGHAELSTFVLDHDYAWADGLICGGKMVILAGCVRGEDAARYFESYRKLLDEGHGLTEVIALDPARCGAPALGARYLFDRDGLHVAGWPDASLPDGLGDHVAPLENRPPRVVRQGAAVLPILPRIRLVIVGAGHVGQAVAELAAKADFDVWVVDDRRQYANAQRFPTAERLIVGPLEEAVSSLEVDARTYALVVTRGHGHDQEAVAMLAPTVAPYVGLIGSRRKIAMIFDELRNIGVDEAALARVAAPVGLDIGSESVTEIAVSIVAELIARRNLGPAAVVPRNLRAPRPRNAPVGP